ncbi:MAG: hypothetical protein E3K40_01195 [Candidatus Brocadia sp.]|nr:hypothetical protein [Candidatus Brocadia sp.]MDG6025330.1 hypothetical protein [Candidatus Brocadia sp.]
MKAKAKKNSDELRPEYKFDYSKAVRGKYYKRILDEGANVVRSRRGVKSLSLKIYLTTCLGNEQKEIFQKFRDLDSKD